MRWLLVPLALLVAAPAAAAKPSWIERVRKATVSDDHARACAVPRIIRYHSTRALLRRAAREPERYNATAVRAWRLRLLELKRAAESCLAPDAARARAELVVDVDLPPAALAEDWFDEDEEEVVPAVGRDLLVIPPTVRGPPDARPPVVSN
jgi:hypothetical protein